MLFHIYLFVLFAGIGIGSVEYIRWCERSLPVSADIPPEIALTFDDGPHPVYTKKLLDGLRKRGVKATFFLIGENIEGNEELVKQMAEDGHLIGNHTWSHVDVTKMSDKQACEEITKTSELVRSIVGYDTEYISFWGMEQKPGVRFWDVSGALDHRSAGLENRKCGSDRRKSDV